MPQATPASANDLAEALHSAAEAGKSITLLGNNSKKLMAGPITPADVVISTSGLTRVLQYEPNDLTVSVEAGMRFSALQEMLARHGQMIALDPPFRANASIGGVVASNSSGPMRAAFGTARDLVIGMKFATLEGKIVTTGGMVVKNVAGLDMGKLMVGSFGTLAAITSVNLRLHPLPERTASFLFSFANTDDAVNKRDAILNGVLRPITMDLISPPAAARLGRRGYVLALRAGGSRNVLARYEKELSGSERLDDADDARFWNRIREFTCDFLTRQPGGIVLRISTVLTETRSVLKLISGPAISRAASGVIYAYLNSWVGIAALQRAAVERGWKMAVEYAPDDVRAGKDLWLLPPQPAQAAAFVMMEKVKHMFDPNNILNRSRLYGRI